VTRPEISDSIFISEVNVTNHRVVSEKFILNRLGIKNGDRITLNDLEEGINNLYGTLYFTKILYEIQKSEAGKVLVIEVAEAPEGQLRGAIQYDMETDISLLLNLTYRNLLLDNSRIILESEISSNSLFDISYLKYFGDRENQSFITGYHHRNIGIPLVENGKKSALYETNLNRIYAGFQSSSRTNRIIRLLYAHERAALKPEIVSAENYAFHKLNYEADQVLFNIEDNDLNCLYYPTQGGHFRADLKYMSAINLEMKNEPDQVSPAPALTLRAPASFSPTLLSQWVIPLNERLSLNLKAVFDFNIHVRESSDSLELGSGVLDMNYIGGYRKLMSNFYPFWGAALQEYHSEHLFAGEMSLQHQIASKVYLRMIGQFYHAYLPFGWLFPGMKESIYNMGGRDYLMGFGASVGYMSRLGPISFSAGKDVHCDGMRCFLNLGFYFDRN
jgi:NTE family protein